MSVVDAPLPPPRPTRRFVVVGQRAATSDGFLLDDLPGTSGRLDLLLRCVRAALLTSHGIRHQVVVYLVLQGPPRGPRTIRIDGSFVRFVRPDERSLAVLAKKILARGRDEPGGGFAEIRAGITIATGGLDVVFADAPTARVFVLDEHGDDVRVVLRRPDEPPTDDLFLIGDHLGWDDASRDAILLRAPIAIAVGPQSLHSEDVVTLVTNELDRIDANRNA